jgi:N-formylglutamate amidohydrolase
MSRLVLSVPHGGVEVPPDLDPPFREGVDQRLLRSHSDIFTDLLYAVPGARVVLQPWSRFVVDANRAEDQDSEGGVVPVVDFDLHPLYDRGGPEPLERRRRLLRFHRPFHAEVARQIDDPRTVLLIDGHSCAPVGPERSPDPGSERPDAVVGNCGDIRGEATPGGPELTLSPTLARWTTRRLSDWLRHIPAPDAGPTAAVTGRVTLNEPFRGGHVVRRHARWDGGVAGLQLELNQRLWVDDRTLQLRPGRIRWLQKVLVCWVEELMDALGDRPHPRALHRVASFGL